MSLLVSQAYLLVRTLDAGDAGMCFEDQARHLDWFVASHVERQEFVCSLLLHCAMMNANDFPAAKATTCRIVVHSQHVSAVECFDFHSRVLTSHFSEPGFRVSVASDQSGEPGR